MNKLKILHKIPLYAQAASYIKSFNAYKPDIARTQKRLLQEYNGLSEDAMDYKFFLLAHSIEKIFTHINSFRYRSNQKNVNELMNSIAKYENAGYDTARPGYSLAVNALKHYRQKHLDANIVIEEIENFLKNRKSSNLPVGVEKFRRKSKNNSAELSRHSVRNFTKKSVKKQQFDKALTEATASPSSCNRQTYKCHYTNKPNIIKQLLTAQGGLNNYDLPPMLCVITSNTEGYQFVDERNLGFVDGGIFTANLIISLRNNGIEACPLHTAIPKNRYKKICEIIGVSINNQVLVAILAIGYPKDGELVPISYRRSIKEISREI